MQVYEYSEHTPVPHNCIRLLKLLPGEGQTDLEANLQIRAIRQDRQSRQGEHDVPLPEPYEALSYHWGHNDKATKFIKILAQSQSYYIRIKPNLDAALRQLRCAQETRFLWVDALCINQADDDEKTVQILLMSLIYSKAEAVAVWLGPQAERSDQAIEFVRRCLNLDDFDSLVQDSVASKDWAALSDLMRRPWFNRRSVLSCRWVKHALTNARLRLTNAGHQMDHSRDFPGETGYSLLRARLGVMAGLRRRDIAFCIKGARATGAFQGFHGAPKPPRLSRRSKRAGCSPSGLCRR